MTTGILHEVLTLINGIPPPLDFVSRIQPFPQSKNTNPAGNQPHTPDPSSCLWPPLDPLQELLAFLEQWRPELNTTAQMWPHWAHSSGFKSPSHLPFLWHFPALLPVCGSANIPPGLQPQGPALSSASSSSLKVTCSHNTISPSLSIS